MKQPFRNALFVAVLSIWFSAAAVAAEITVYKSPTCGCCKEWVKHLQANGFSVIARDVPDVTQYKIANDVPVTLGSCHTATVDGYVIEGHVPAGAPSVGASRRSPIRGLAVPGMPIGSPGMEQGAHKERYDVLTFDKKGNTSVYARH